jgi:hypothetical protein
MKRTGTVLFILIQSLFVNAQRNKFQIGLGYQRTWIMDKQVSPLKYQTSEKTFSLGYERQNPSGRMTAAIEGALGKLFPTGYYSRQLYNPGYSAEGVPLKDSSSIVGRIYQGRIKIGYLSSIANGFSKIGSNNIHTGDYLGGSVSNQLFYSDNIVRTGWLNSTSLNADYLHDILFNTKHSFNIKISIPLLARNSRLPYHNTISSENGESPVKTFFRQGSRFAWLADFQHIQIDANYEYAIGKRTGIGLHYFGQWLHYRYERPITLFQNNIGIFATVK